jgi:hypothetical protein
MTENRVKAIKERQDVLPVPPLIQYHGARLRDTERMHTAVIADNRSGMLVRICYLSPVRCSAFTQAGNTCSFGAAYVLVSSNRAVTWLSPHHPGRRRTFG